MIEIRNAFEKNTEAIVLYSGGKDSSYTLLRLYETKLFHIHAVTFDNGYILEDAKKNIRKITTELNITHSFISPDAKNFRNALKTCSYFFSEDSKYQDLFRRNGVFCWPCFSFIYNSVYQYAAKNHIAYIFGGWNPGQIAEGAHITEVNGKIPYGEVFEAFVLPFIEFSNLHQCDTSSFVKNLRHEMYVVPYFFFEKYDQKSILKYIAQNGWIQPSDCESCTSNCALNQADRYLYRNKFGYDRYELQIDQMIKKGYATDKEKIQVHEENLDSANALKILEAIRTTL